MKINVFLIIRFLIGCLFIISGGEKLISPYQNFLYVFQGYELLSVPLEKIVAFVMPWFELILGVFLVLGLWLKWTLRGVIAMFATFIFVVSQALIRKLPIEECGCFGSLLTVPLHILLMLDVIFLILTGLLLFKINYTRFLSLDNIFYEKSVIENKL